MLGPYRIAGLLGEGGMGAVYRARDTRLGRDVAIKVLTNVTVNDREKLVRFEQEARAAGMLNHPNLLTIFDVGNAGETPYVVSELLEGETLRERLVRGPIAPRRAAELALGIAHGLAAAHEKGIVHRDLKPENVFGTRDGRVKILDFGIAKLSATLSSSGPLFRMNNTEPGMVMGTVGYMSPEQVRGEDVDPRSDIFAFGAILYEMLTGTRAFAKATAIETLNAILKEDPPDLGPIVANLPPALERLVHRCLEKDRNQRFQSARDLAFNLEVLTTMPAGQSTLTGRGSQPVPARPVAPPPQPAAPPIQSQLASQFDTTLTRAPHPSGIRPTRQPSQRVPTVSAKKPLVSPMLLAALAVVALAGAAFAGWYFARREQVAVESMSFRRVTFRRGEVRSARFTPDGETIVYSAAWDGRAADVFVASRHSPEARELGIRDAEVLAVSKAAEVAVLLRRDRLTGQGTLARVPIAGGVPREIANGVLYADFSPDGTDMAVIRTTGSGFRLEYPIGKRRYETQHYIRDVRVAPDGKTIAFLEPHGGANDIVVIEDGDEPEPVARGWSRGASGLAWSPDGDELWISGTDTAAPPALWAVTLGGSQRLISRLTGAMKLFDISSAGRVLVTNGTWRAALHYSPPGNGGDRDVSWLDWSIAADLSADGRTILFNETREGGGAGSSIYLRRGDAPPVRIGEGFGDALSPDATRVLCHSGGKLMIIPTGAGEQRELKVEGSFELGGVWLPDARRVVMAGAQPKGQYRLLLIDTELETVNPISPENIVGGATRPFAVSPDGRQVAGMSRDGLIVLYPTGGAIRSNPVRGVRPGEVPIQWSADGQSLYVYNPTSLPARIFRIDMADGSRHEWRQFAPSDPAGVYRISPVLITPHGHAYAYNALRTLNDLYIAEGFE